MMEWDSPEVADIVSRALHEDIGAGDITSRWLIPEDHQTRAVFLAKQHGVLAGLPLLPLIFQRLDPDILIELSLQDGSAAMPGASIARIAGNTRAILEGERVALNLLQRLSGIATQTAGFVAIAAASGVAVLDTRKTTPLLRILEKYAVVVGGGQNNRIGLFDRILVKDNHLRVQSDFTALLDAFRKGGYNPEVVQVEVTSLEMLKKAMDAGVVWFLLDNMTPALIRRCVKIKRNNVTYEVSGGITAKNFAHYVIPGVDGISIGALTHSVKSMDISLEFD
jgi:nicotinate-nucleotide pyrophosphorylase (carboxylating)